MTPYYETELDKLYHGDCLEIMPELEPVDLVLTDPPYNSSYGADIKRKWRPNPIKHDFGDWDKGFNPLHSEVYLSDDDHLSNVVTVGLYTI